MKNWMPLLPIVLMAHTVHGQSCSFASDPFYGHELWYQGGYTRDDGSAQTMGNGVAPRSSLFTHWGADGQVDWNRYFQQMDPTNHMWGNSVARSASGGIVTSGVFYHGLGVTYTNLFGAVLDANGAPVWARYYMLDPLNVADELDMYSQMDELPGGGYVFLIQTRRLGLVLSKLDVNGIPIWTKRYWPGTMDYDDVGVPHYYCNVIAENNGEFTLFGTKSKVPFMIRLDQNGGTLWKRTFSKAVGKGMELSNGDYICSGTTIINNVVTAYITRLDHQGNVLWHRSGLNGRFQELASGHLLVTASGYLTTSLTELDANGAFIQHWTAPMQEWPEYAPELEFLQSRSPRGDSLIMATDGYYAGPIAPFMISASSAADLTCFGFTPAAAINVPLETNPVDLADDTLDVVVDSLKTWTMLISTVQDANAFDPAVDLSGSYPSPGYDHTIYGEITNNGSHSTGPVTATMTFDPGISYVGASPVATSVAGQTITWQLPPLPAHSHSLVNATFHTPPDVGLLGNYMDFTLSFTQDSAESSLLNNTVSYHTQVIGSYDPNDKSVSPKDYYAIQSDSTLQYTIRFQNTGTAPAQTVVVRDTLPMDVDTRTFELLVTSHPCTYSITGNGILTFTFNNIDLPDSNTSEAASHGLVSFRIDPILPLTLGQVISNNAGIYFDFNPPVITNDASVVVTDQKGCTLVLNATVGQPGAIQLAPTVVDVLCHGGSTGAVDPTGPTGPRLGAQRLNRGGSWIDDPRFLRVADRSRNEPGTRLIILGFRIARSR